jgi:hypothetical protein
VTVAGRTLHGPLTYVMRDERNADASTIVTSLRVASPFGAEPLPYWPSYTGASAAQRAVYLDWCAGGRSDAEVPIGYVFVHFYPERRALVDGAIRDRPRRAQAPARDLWTEQPLFADMRPA